MHAHLLLYLSFDLLRGVHGLLNCLAILIIILPPPSYFGVAAEGVLSLFVLATVKLLRRSYYSAHQQAVFLFLRLGHELDGRGVHACVVLRVQTGDVGHGRLQ